MKPTHDQMLAWAETVASSGKDNSLYQFIQEHPYMSQNFATLAAQWGAEQSQDGKRYRWLKEECHEFKPAHWDGLPYGRHYIDLLRVDESDLDIAVDAAMKGEQL